DGAIDRGMKVFDDNAFFERFAGAFISGYPVQIAALKPSAAHQDTAGIREMAVHAIVFHFRDDVRDNDLVFHRVIGLAFDHHVAAEFAGEDDQCSVQETTLLKIENELGN